MATNNQPQGEKKVQGYLVRATVILRIPDLDTAELTKLHEILLSVTSEFGGEFDINTAQQLPQQGQ